MNSTIRATRPESIGSFQDQKWREGVNGRLLSVTETHQSEIDALDSRLDLLEPAVAANTASIAAINSSLPGYALKAANESITGNWDFGLAARVTTSATILAPGANTTFRNIVDNKNILIGGGSAVDRANGAGLVLWGNAGAGQGTLQVFAGGQGAQIWGTTNWIQMRGSDPGGPPGGSAFVAFAEADPSTPGQAHIYTGNAASAKIRNRLTSTSHTVEYEFAGTTKYYFGDNTFVHNDNFALRTNTGAGGDNKAITISPCSQSSDMTPRASWLQLTGGQHSNQGKFVLSGWSGSVIQAKDTSGAGVGGLSISAATTIGGGTTTFLTAISANAFLTQLSASQPEIRQGFYFLSSQNQLSGNDLVMRGKIRIVIDGNPYAIPYLFWN